MHTVESKFFNFLIAYLGEIETEFKHIIACLLWAQMGSNHEKKLRQKSCDTLPFTLFLYLQLPFCHFLCFSYLSILFKFFLLVYYTIFPSCVLPVLPTFLFSLLALQHPCTTFLPVHLLSLNKCRIYHCVAIAAR